ncbi:MAG TPA: serine/threonine-protein kinase, partial [Polyangiaceae bacterium]|nr:serine/threonine-protein kinase [Polyangiaceae bacterium]
ASLAPPGDVAASLDARLAAVLSWTQDGLLDPSSRAEALRTVVVRLYQSASAIAHARSLADLCTGGGTEPDVVATFEDAMASFMQLSHGARARLNPDGGTSAPPMPVQDEALAVAVSRVLSGAEEALDGALVDGARRMAAELPVAMEALVSLVIDVVTRLPARVAEARAGAARINEQLPAWLPPRRTLGGFYVLRPLGSGAGGSVLVACRAEERQEPDAERFALKVPAYDAVAARSVSEAEFFQMFRAEASALLSLPAHPNLARFVTFDTGTKPKPILVMELVEGPNLDHEIEARALDVSRCFRILDDVLAGLEAMHSVEVGHLDIKPANVVLRGGREAVLVDFGLAGRRLRPGCGTGPYGAPEVWGAEAPGTTPTPMKADVYAFGCVAFEMLTGDTLFAAEGELQQVALHLSHDGFPDKLRKMASRPELAPLAEILFSTLRRDPGKRPTPHLLRIQLRQLEPSLQRMRWPLPA